MLSSTSTRQSLGQIISHSSDDAVLFCSISAGQLTETAAADSVTETSVCMCSLDGAVDILSNCVYNEHSYNSLLHSQQYFYFL